MAFIIQWVEAGSGAEELTPIETPVGKLVIVSRQDVVIQVDWLPAQQDGLNLPAPANKLFQRLLNDYFHNPHKDIPVKFLSQGSVFSHKVWAEMLNIPCGKTLTYTDIAKTLTSSPRAVGNACRANPYPLFIPCHRVVSVTGIGGYCGQTEGDFMNIKRKLLAFEAANNP
ncbi:MAG: methylated-DNA--[protein]-cysteine S-methyltransferase [Methylococcales bacterium]